VRETVRKLGCWIAGGVVFVGFVLIATPILLVAWITSKIWSSKLARFTPHAHED